MIVTINMKVFKEMLMMNEFHLKNTLAKTLEVTYGYKTVYNFEDYVYAPGTLPVMLVAHVDTVHDTKPEKIYHDQEEGVLWSPEGIGGDDRCGVYAILKLLKKHRPHILFTDYEESGGYGASAFVADFPGGPTVNYMIQLDRHGKDDAVFYDCGNKEFQDFILGNGFKLNHGTFSDISILSPAFDLASVNLSVGYYNEHTCQEYIKTEELSKTIEKVDKILSLKNAERYDFQDDLGVIEDLSFNYLTYGKKGKKDKFPKKFYYKPATNPAVVSNEFNDYVADYVSRQEERLVNKGMIGSGTG